MRRARSAQLTVLRLRRLSFTIPGRFSMKRQAVSTPRTCSRASTTPSEILGLRAEAVEGGAGDAANRDGAFGDDLRLLKHLTEQLQPARAALGEHPHADGGLLDTRLEEARGQPVGGRRRVGVPEAAGVEDDARVEQLGDGAVDGHPPQLEEGVDHLAGARRPMIEQNDVVAVGLGGPVVVDDGGPLRRAEGRVDGRLEAVAVAIHDDDEVVVRADLVVRDHLVGALEPVVAIAGGARHVHRHARKAVAEAGLQGEAGADAVAVGIDGSGQQDPTRAGHEAAEGVREGRHPRRRQAACRRVSETLHGDRGWPPLMGSSHERVPDYWAERSGARRKAAECTQFRRRDRGPSRAPSAAQGPQPREAKSATSRTPNAATRVGVGSTAGGGGPLPARLGARGARRFRRRRRRRREATSASSDGGGAGAGEAADGAASADGRVDASPARLRAGAPASATAGAPHLAAGPGPWRTGATAPAEAGIKGSTAGAARPPMRAPGPPTGRPRVEARLRAPAMGPPCRAAPRSA